MRKHDNLCEKLAKILNEKPYVYEVTTNEEYDKGECDVKACQKYGVVYYEVKCTDKPAALYKATNQLLRWTKWYNKRYKVNAYGVYWTPTRMQYIAKNGKLRK